MRLAVLTMSATLALATPASACFGLFDGTWGYENGAFSYSSPTYGDVQLQYTPPMAPVAYGGYASYGYAAPVRRVVYAAPVAAPVMYRRAAYTTPVASPYVSAAYVSRPYASPIVRASYAGYRTVGRPVVRARYLNGGVRMRRGWRVVDNIR